LHLSGAGGKAADRCNGSAMESGEGLNAMNSVSAKVKMRGRVRINFPQFHAGQNIRCRVCAVKIEKYDRRLVIGIPAMTTRSRRPPNSCRRCGSTSYRPVIARDEHGALKPNGVFTCTGCELQFLNINDWRLDASEQQPASTA
jgi:hypothetical protein